MILAHGFKVIVVLHGQHLAKSGIDRMAEVSESVVAAARGGRGSSEMIPKRSEYGGLICFGGRLDRLLKEFGATSIMPFVAEIVTDVRLAVQSIRVIRAENGKIGLQSLLLQIERFGIVLFVAQYARQVVHESEGVWIVEAANAAAGFQYLASASFAKNFARRPKEVLGTYATSAPWGVPTRALGTHEPATDWHSESE